MTDEERHALAEKYREMIALRREPGPKDDARLRALSTRFPGSLRELDSRPMESLVERLSALEEGTDAPWIGLQLRFHGWLRIALRVRAERDVDAWLASYEPREPGDPTHAELTSRIASLIAPREGRVSLAARDALDAGDVDLDRLLFGRSAK